MTITLTPEQKKKLLNSEDVYSVMQEILLREEKIDQEKEHLWIIGLASNNGILFLELVSLGSVNATVVEHMNVFRVSVMKGAVNVILVHNHPSGELAPSDEDIDLTDRHHQVGRILNIQLLDHLIISDKNYLSFTASGMMEGIKKSTKWVPQFELVEKIKAQEKKIKEGILLMAKEREKGKKEGMKEGEKKGKEEGLKMGEKKGLEKGKKEEKIAMAKAMKKDKEPLEKIIRYTGLSEAEIRKLK